MSSVVTGAATGSGNVRLPMGPSRRLTPAEESTARAKAAQWCCPLEQAMFLIAGGTLADWYACAAPPPPETPEDKRVALLARLIRMMPDGLSPDEQAAYIASAERRVGT